MQEEKLFLWHLPAKISTKTLVAAAQERGLIGEGKWVYHNFSRKVRESDLFDTSVRGQVSLVGNVEPEPVEVEVETAPAEDLTADGFVDEPETEVQVERFPGPTLGSGFAE